MKTKFFIQAQWKSLWLKQQFMKSDQKCNCNVSNACLCLDRSANQFSFSLAIFDWSPQKTLMLNVQPSNLSICAPAKIAWGWICWTVKTFCCVVVEVLTWFSSDWADVPGSRFRVQTFLAVASEMLNASCRAFSNFCDRLAVQRSLAERLLREVVQHWSF